MSKSKKTLFVHGVEIIESVIVTLNKNFFDIVPFEKHRLIMLANDVNGGDLSSVTIH
jgi:hypothetical protein